jgi:hypothetical protein
MAAQRDRQSERVAGRHQAAGDRAQAHAGEHHHHQAGAPKRSDAQPAGSDITPSRTVGRRVEFEQALDRQLPDGGQGQHDHGIERRHHVHQRVADRREQQDAAGRIGGNLHGRVV